MVGDATTASKPSVTSWPWDGVNRRRTGGREPDRPSVSSLPASPAGSGRRGRAARSNAGTYRQGTDMRKVILKMHTSLDGYVRDAGGEVRDWIFRSYDEELQAWEVDLLWQAGTHVMGRRLYEEMAAYWPRSTEPFAQPMNEIPKVVFSRTMRRADWGPSRVFAGAVEAELARLKQDSGKDILAHGGAEFAQALSGFGLIDEYRLIVHPVFLAGGLPLFRTPTDLKLLGVRSFPAGAVAVTYGRA